MMQHFVLNAIVLCLALAVVYALPSGAPSCTVGGPAPENLHLDKNRDPLRDEISAEDYQVFIGEKQVMAGTPLEVQVGENHTLTIASSTGARFKGALVLLSKDDKNYSDALLVSSDKFQPSLNCVGEPIAGITHVDRSYKTEFEATLRLEENDKQIYLDVNIVPQNNFTKSIYYYSRFEIEGVGGEDRKASKIQDLRTVWTQRILPAIAMWLVGTYLLEVYTLRESGMALTKTAEVKSATT